MGGVPGLGLPFCTLQSLILDNVTLEPPFANDTVVYAASAAHDVESTTVTATLHNGGDTVSITKGGDTYMNSVSVPLDVGPNVITITVTTTDDTPSPPTYTVTVTRAPNTPPTFTDGPTTTRGVDENTATNENIGGPVGATDDDDNDTLTYSLDATSAASFDIDADGQLRTKADLDYETTSSYTVTVSVSDSMDDNSAADAVTDDTITVTILVANMNEAPEFPTSETGMRSVDENTRAGVNIGAPVAATDDDRDPLTYSLGPRSGTDVLRYCLHYRPVEDQGRLGLRRHKPESTPCIVAACGPVRHDGRRHRPSPSPLTTSRKRGRSHCRRRSP